MNLSGIIENLGPNTTAVLNFTEICGAREGFYQSVGIRIPVMVIINLMAVIIMSVSYKLMQRGRMERGTWSQKLFEPCMVALIISSIFLMEVIFYGLS